MEEAGGCFVIPAAAGEKLGKTAWLIEKLGLVQAASARSEIKVIHWCQWVMEQFGLSPAGSEP